MAPPRGEPEYGMGSAANAANVSAGFKIETKSLDNLITRFERLVTLVKDFNKELGRVNGGALGQLGGGGARGAGGGMLNAGGFSLPPGAGRTQSGLILPNGGIPPVQPHRGAPAAPAAGGGGSGFKYTPMQVVGAAAGGALYGVAGYVDRNRGDMASMERFAQVQSWGTAGNTNANMGAFRHQMVGASGYTSTSDLLTGGSVLRGAFGYGNTQQIQNRYAGASGFANVLGSFEQGAQATASLYSPQAYYNLLGLGVQTRGPGGQMASESDITKQLLSRIYGGRLPSLQELQAGSAQGSNLQATLNSLGLDQSAKDAILQTGMLQAKSSWSLTNDDFADISGSKAGKDALGNSLYDQQRDQARAAAQVMEEMADGALPAMKRAVEAVTDALYTLSGAGGLLAGAGAVGGIGGPVAGMIGGAANSMLGLAAFDWLRNRRANRPGPRPSPAGRLTHARAAGGIAGLVGGAVAAPVVTAATGSSAAGNVAGMGVAGAGLGFMVGGPVGAAIGGGLGLLGGGLMEGLGGPGDGGFTTGGMTATINRSEAEVLSAGWTGSSGSDGPSRHGAGQDGTSTAGTSDSPPMYGNATQAAGGATTATTERGRKALAWMQRESQNPTGNWENLCLRATRMALGAPGGVEDASTAWMNTKIRRGKGTPPPGVPVWWSGGQGHVALSAGGGKVWSNDIRRKGKIDLVTIDEINRKWGKPYHGWTEDINGVDVYDEKATNEGTTAASGSSGMSPEAAKMYARNRLSSYGWGGDQWAALEQLWEGESNWRYKAANPTSAARGIPQAMMSAHYGKNWTSNPAAQKYLNDARVQIDWGLKYIKGRYGTPSKAWASWQSRSPHWYAEGGIATGPRMIGVGERGPEAIIPLNGKGIDTLSQAFIRAQRESKRGNNTVGTTAQVRERASVSVTLNMPIQMAKGSTQREAERLVSMVLRELETNDRLAAVMGGDN